MTGWGRLGKSTVVVAGLDETVKIIDLLLVASIEVGDGKPT